MPVSDRGLKACLSARLVAALLVGTQLSGCAGARLYSEARDRQGIAAKAEWAKVDLTRIVNEDRENLKKVLRAQLETQDRVSAAIRTFTLRAMLQAPTVDEGIRARVDQSLGKVVGNADINRKMVASRQRDEDHIAARRKRDIHASTFYQNGLAVPDCASIELKNTAPDEVVNFIGTANANRAAAIVGAVAALREVCAVSENSRYEGLGGQVAVAVQREAEDRAALERVKEKSAALRLEYQAAKSAYEQAVKDTFAGPGTLSPTRSVPGATATTSTSVTTPTAVALDCKEPAGIDGENMRAAAEAAHRLCRAVTALDNADDAFAIRLLSKDRLDSIEEFIKAMTQSAADGKVPEGAGQAATAYILLPKLLDDGRQSLAAGRMPLAMPLLIRRNIEQLKLDGSTKEIALLETRVKLSAAITAALFQQAVQLWHASRTLASPLMSSVLGMTVTYALSTATPDQKEQLYYATAQYLDAINRLDARWRKLEYQRIATFHEISLSYAEVNLKQWSSLIGSAVDQVAESAASGLKTEDVTGLANAFGLLWIGRGVNK